MIRVFITFISLSRFSCMPGEQPSHIMPPEELEKYGFSMSEVSMPQAEQRVSWGICPVFSIRNRSYVRIVCSVGRSADSRWCSAATNLSNSSGCGSRSSSISVVNSARNSAALRASRSLRSPGKDWSSVKFVRVDSSLLPRGVINPTVPRYSRSIPPENPDFSRREPLAIARIRPRSRPNRVTIWLDSEYVTFPRQIAMSLKFGMDINFMVGWGRRQAVILNLRVSRML